MECLMWENVLVLQACPIRFSAIMLPWSAITTAIGFVTDLTNLTSLPTWKTLGFYREFHNQSYLRQPRANGTFESFDMGRYEGGTSDLRPNAACNATFVFPGNANATYELPRIANSTFDLVPNATYDLNRSWYEDCMPIVTPRCHISYYDEDGGSEYSWISEPGTQPSETSGVFPLPREWTRFIPYRKGAPYIAVSTCRAHVQGFFHLTRFPKPSKTSSSVYFSAEYKNLLYSRILPYLQYYSS